MAGPENGAENGPGAARVLVGAIVGPHGVRGLVKVRSYTAEPADIAAYGPLSDENGRRRLELEVLSAASGGPGTLICRIAGLADREAAVALKGLRLHVPRAALPPVEAPEEYYQADLVGLAAELADGSAFGRVVAVQNYGAGDILEVEIEAAGAGRGRSVDLPFTRAVVPVVDIAGGRVVVDPPPELLEAGGPAPEGERKDG